MGLSDEERIMRAMKLAQGAEAYHEDFWPADFGGWGYSNVDIGDLVEMVQGWTCDQIADFRLGLFNAFGMPFVCRVLEDIMEGCC